MPGICYVAPDVEIPSARGASTHVLELSRALVARGIPVHVVCEDSPGRASEEYLGGVVLHRIPRWPRGTSRGGALGIRSHAKSDGLSSRLYRMYLQTLNALRVGLAAGSIVKNHSLHAIVERETAYGAGAVASYMTGRALLLEIIGPRTSPLSVSRSSRIMAYSDSMVPTRARSRAVYVDAAVNPDLFKDDKASGERLRQRYGFLGATVVGYVGTFQAFHGVADLLDAAAIALKLSPGLKFLLVGPSRPEDEARVRGLGISDSVIFTGPVPYEEVPKYVNASDFLVAPYNTKGSERSGLGIGSPLKVLEYMSAGKATIGSSLPPVAAILTDGLTGLLFPEGDVAALAEKIIMLAADPALRHSLGMNASQLVRKKYTWDSLALLVERNISAIPRGG